MKTLALTLLFAVASAGCLDLVVPPHAAAGADMATAATGTGGNGPGTGGATDDMGDDDGGAATPGTKAFGDACTVNGDCQSALCEQFVQGTVHRCSKPCTAATQATDCPAPSDGTCTPNLYCKFDQ
ncbi:MAG TPA: hypothetical protein VN947_21215 [Polyangia bacterium]|nr:hypothetical protein [Polyangia bacterium]